MCLLWPIVYHYIFIYAHICIMISCNSTVFSHYSLYLCIVLTLPENCFPVLSGNAKYVLGMAIASPCIATRAAMTVQRDQMAKSATEHAELFGAET